MIQDILTGIPLGIFLSFLIGPVFFVLLETSAVKGFRAALAFDLGVIFADVLFILIAYGSSYRLIMSIKNDPGIFIFGGIVMMSYGAISFIKLRKAGRALKEDKEVAEVLIKKNYHSLFWKGFLLNFINVGVLLFWFMILISVGPKFNLDTSRLVTFFSAVLGTYLVVDIGKIVAAKQLKTRLTPKNILRIKEIISVMLVVFGIIIIAQVWFPAEQKFVKNALEQIK
jgi:threonine/homoserine/homoserine lactone efflux protein